jgi:hypothetical protein
MSKLDPSKAQIEEISEVFDFPGTLQRFRRRLLDVEHYRSYTNFMRSAKGGLAEFQGYKNYRISSSYTGKPGEGNGAFRIRGVEPHPPCRINVAGTFLAGALPLEGESFDEKNGKEVHKGWRGPEEADAQMQLLGCSSYFLFVEFLNLQ